MERVALSLAHTGRFPDPYPTPTGYTAHVAPGYAVILAAIFRLFGEGYRGEFAKEFASTAAAAAQYALLPAIAPALGIARGAGVAAGLFAMAFPLEYSTEVVGDWDATFAGLALALMIWATAATWRRSYFRGAAAMAAAPALCLAPWAWRNERRLGALIFTRSNFGLELRLSNHDSVSPLEWVNYEIGNYYRYHPSFNADEAQAVRRMGEPAYNRARLRLALEWISSHRRAFASLTLHRLLYTWFPDTPAKDRDAVLRLETIAAALGLIALWRTQRDFAALSGSAAIAFTFIYSFIQVNVRCRYPIDWIVLLLAAHCAAIAAGSLAAKWRERTKGEELWQVRAT